MDITIEREGHRAGFQAFLEVYNEQAKRQKVHEIVDYRDVIDPVTNQLKRVAIYQERESGLVRTRWLMCLQ